MLRADTLISKRPFNTALKSCADYNPVYKERETYLKVPLSFGFLL